MVDPRRTKTAEEADEHLPIRPATDALFLFALVHVLFADDLVDLGDVADVRERSRRRAPRRRSRVHARGGRAGRAASTPTTIRRIARELAAAPTAAVYGRIGTCTQEFGTLASWLVDVVNVCTGNLDRPGGAMFTQRGDRRRPATARRARGAASRSGAARSRVRGLPEFFGELPVVCLAEEIETPGDGQIRALVTVAGNPAVSTPELRPHRSARSPTLDFMVSVDIYLNETTRHAERDPAARAGAGARSLRPRALQPRDPQRRELLAAARRARARRGSGVALDAAARGRARRARARTPTSTRSTISSSSDLVQQGGRAHAARTSKDATPTS